MQQVVVGDAKDARASWKKRCGAQEPARLKAPCDPTFPSQAQTCT